MGSSGGGRDPSFEHRQFTASDFLNKLKSSNNEVEKQEYEARVSSIISELLSKYNNRDTETIARHLQEIKKALNNEIEGTVTTQFGGSLSKHTHLTGLSDVDTLVILNNSELKGKTPAQVLKYFAETIEKRFPQTSVKIGDTAITVGFKDGDVQLIPAIRNRTGLRIPDGSDWSNTVNPTLFARQLTVLNHKMGGRLIPTIKIIKGIVSKFPENTRLTGYHIESLALKVFQDKDWTRSKITIQHKELIKNFFKEAAKEVKTPIKDVTRQSKSVDEYLGGKNSVNRLKISDILDKNHRRLELADSSRLVDMWKEILVI